MHFVLQIAVKSKDRAFFKLDASRSTSEPYWAPFGPLLGPFGEVFLRLLGFFDHSWADHGPPIISFWPPTSRQKGLWSAKLERLEPHNLVLEPLDLILEPPGTHFDPSGSCFGASR